MANDVTVPIKGDDSDLARVIKRSKARLGKFASDARRHTNTLGKAGIASGVALTAATAAIVKHRSQVIDALAKTSDALGIQTQKLQALNHMAELNGVSSDQMAKGLQRMERGLGEAARKGGATADALEDAGLSIQSIINLSPDQQIQKLAGAIANVENQSVKASIASDLFGRDGVRMLKVLNQLEKDGIEPTAKELENLGVSLSRVDAAKVEAANDAFFKAQQVISGAANTLTVKLAPFIEEAANRFTNLARETGGFGDEIESAFTKGIRFGGKLNDVIRGVQVAFKSASLVAHGFQAAVNSVAQLVLEGFGKLADGVIWYVNDIIRALNKLPNVDIATVDPFTNSAFMKGFRTMSDQSRNQVAVLRAELHALAMQELPSKAVEEFLQAVINKSNEAAEATAGVTSGLGGESGGGSSFSSDNSKGESMDAKVQALRERFATEKELLEIKLAEDNEMLKTALELERITEQEHLDLSKQAKKAYEDEITAIDKAGSEIRLRQIQDESRLRVATMRGALSDLSTLMNSENKKQFEIGKKAAIANTIIETYTSAQKAFSAMASIPYVGPVLGAAAAAAAIGAGMQRVSAIKSQSFGGGGAGAQATGSNTAAVNAASTPVGGGSGGAGAGTLTVEGLNPSSLFSGEQTRELANALLEHQRNGGEVLLA